MNETPFLGQLRDFAIAMLIGALVGIERETRKPERGASGVPGVRTFTLLALIGALAGWLSRQFDSVWILVGAMLGVAAAIVAGYVVQTRSQPDSLGLTTELAGLTVCLLGALTVIGQAGLAVALGIVLSALLAYKQPIHGLVRKLGTDDLYAGLKLLIATFIVLPVLPNRTVDPWGALNPYMLWWLVILICGLSLVGYVATRCLGAERGMALTGLTGGLVSSTAVTLAFSKRSREGDGAGVGNALATGILLAWVVMFVRVLVAVAVVNPALLSTLLTPMSFMGLATLALAAVYHWRGHSPSASPRPPAGQVPLRNPFSLAAAVKFALFFALVLLVVKLVQQHFPGKGVYLVAGLAGLTDVDAITLSMADNARQTGKLDTATAAITVAAISNTLAKAGLTAVLGSRPLRQRILIATGLILVCGVGSLWLL